MEIGYVARAHGLRGEFRVRLHWEESDALDSVTAVFIGKTRDQSAEPRKYQLLGARRIPQGYLLSVDEVNDKVDADALRGSTLYVERSALPALEADEYYLSDLIGFEVWCAEQRVGPVVDLSLHPSVDCIVVEAADGRRLEQPLLAPWLTRVDLEHRRVELANLDGVIE